MDRPVPMGSVSTPGVTVCEGDTLALALSVAVREALCEPEALMDALRERLRVLEAVTERLGILLALRLALALRDAENVRERVAARLFDMLRVMLARRLADAVRDAVLEPERGLSVAVLLPALRLLDAVCEDERERDVRAEDEADTLDDTVTEADADAVSLPPPLATASRRSRKQMRSSGAAARGAAISTAENARVRTWL